MPTIPETLSVAFYHAYRLSPEGDMLGDKIGVAHPHTDGGGVTVILDPGAWPPDGPLILRFPMLRRVGG